MFILNCESSVLQFSDEYFSRLLNKNLFKKIKKSVDRSEKKEYNKDS